MKNGPFINMIANVLGVERKTVIVHARALREAGLLTTGSRGVNAPHMNAMDAARLTLALLTGQTPKYVVNAVNHFRALTPTAPPTEGRRDIEEVLGFNSETTIEQVLHKLFLVYGDPDGLKEYNFMHGPVSMRPFVSIKIIENRLQFSLNFEGSFLIFQSPLYILGDPGTGMGMRTVREMTTVEIVEIALRIPTADGVID